MEVFLRGVPQHFSDKALAEALGPLMRALNVGEWITKKQRRNGIAWITFLEEGDGWRFLEKHGMQEPPSPSDPSSSYTHIAIRTTPTGDSYIARLFLMVTPVLAQLSDRVVDQLTLNHLRFQRDQRAQEPRDEPRGPALACMVTEISCGHNMFLSGGDTPTFVQQSVLPTRCSVNIGRRFFVATFEDGSRMNIAFDTVDSWVFSYGHDTLSLILKESPKCFRRSETFLPLSVKWDRCLFLPSWPDHAKYMANCLVYQFSLSAFKREDLVAHLESVETVSLSICNSPIIRSPRPFVVDYTTAYHVFEDQINANDSSLVPYALRFQVQMLVWNAYLHPSNALDLLKLLRDEFRAAKSRGHGAPVTTESLKPLFDNIPYASPGREAKDFSAQALMKYILLNEAELRHGNPNRDKLYGPQLPNSQIWVFKAHVTPTSIRLSGPEPENKNSVWRTYEDRSDYFLRVTFCDEDHKRPQYNTNVSTKDVSNRYREVFRTGIFIAGRHFSFLGFSHSSLRAHTTWFSAPFVDENGVRHTPETILKALGSFDHISVPARYAARIGQAFSETPYAISLGQCGIVVKDIEDIQSSDGSRVFSDGIGTLSRGALDEILQFLPWHSAASTCLQIRLGGVKGVLSLDSRLGGKVICICDSMRKFPSDSNDELGICETGSRPLPMWLNRQLIKIMEDLGTDPDWIKGQQRKNIEALRQVGTSPEKAGAFLESQGIGRHIKFPWLMKQLSEMDLDFRSDKYLKSVVEHAVLRELRLLKYKARIRVEQGVTLFGVLDEHDFLEEDQVYVTYDRKHRLFSGGIGLSIQDGPVLVTRSPALHPGDVRVVKHVTPPAEHPLRELRNCIVFSQKGERGLPSQLSGGDLDGDLYNIIWDSGALPRKQSTPAGYPHVHAKPLDRDVTQDDIANFFIKFMETDILGVIATRHQVLSDISGMGTCDATCIKLAEMHSVAVDYAKTGKAVELSELPRAPRTRPDL